MKIKTQEHTLNHPWETVAQAAWRKYPNPQNGNVTGLDVLDRKIDSNGILHSHRLMRTEWGLPQWATNLIGLNLKQPIYVSEHSEVDPKQKTMTLKSKNWTFCNYVSYDEKLTYSSDPEDPNKTNLTHETAISVSNVPLTSYMESLFINNSTSNSSKGLEAMEWVINNIKNETADTWKKALTAVDKYERQFTKETEDLKRKAMGAVKGMDKVIKNSAGTPL